MPSKAPKPIPDGMHTITPHLWFRGDCAKAIKFYEKAFGMKLVGEAVSGPEDTGIMHAMMKWGDSNIMMADAWPGNPETAPDKTTTVGFFIYLDDVDPVFEKVVKAGCEVLSPLKDEFWGDRMGKVRDPFGHVWGLATNKWIFSEEEMAQNHQHWEESLD